MCGEWEAGRGRKKGLCFFFSFCSLFCRKGVISARRKGGTGCLIKWCSGLGGRGQATYKASTCSWLL